MFYSFKFKMLKAMLTDFKQLAGESWTTVRDGQRWTKCKLGDRMGRRTGRTRIVKVERLEENSNWHIWKCRSVGAVRNMANGKC